MSRRRRLLLVVLVAGVATAGGARAQAADPPVGRVGASSPHIKCFGPIALTCDAASVAGDVVSDVVGGAAEAAGDAALDGISSWVGAGAAWLVKRIAKSVERSTRPELEAPWFDRQYAQMLQLALIAALVFLLIALASAALRGDVMIGIRAAFVALPAAIIVSFAAITITQLFLAATDEAARMLTVRTGGQTDDFFKELAGALGDSGPVPGFIALMGACIATVLCFVVWIELILREAAIYLAVGFLPLSLAAVVWRRTAHLARQLVEGLVAIILAKLTIAAALAFAASALTGGGKGGVTVVMAGCATLFLAALSPWVLLKLIPLAGEQVGLRRGSVKQAARSAPGVSSAAMVVSAGMSTAFAGAASSRMASGAAASSAPATAWRPPTPPPERPTPTGDPRSGGDREPASSGGGPGRGA